MIAPRHGHFASRGLNLHFVEWGKADAPPALLIHGGRDHARSWDDVAQALAPCWRVIAPDLRGHGDSDWATGGYGINDFITDLAVLVATIGNWPLPIIAHSLGGNIALRYAALFPEHVSRLVAIEGLSPLPDPATEAVDQADRLRHWVEAASRRATVRRHSYPDVAAAAARMQALNPRLTDRLASHLAAHGTCAGEDGRLRFKFDPSAHPLSPIDLSYAQKLALWARIACPVLLVYGRESWATNPAEDGRMEAFRHGRAALFDGAGHWVHHDRLEAFLTTVTSFLET